MWGLAFDSWFWLIESNLRVGQLSEFGVGIEPVRALLSRDNVSRAVKSPISVGIEPERELSLRSM